MILGILEMAVLHRYFFSSFDILQWGHSLLIVEASRSHSDTPQSVGFLWIRDQLDAETST
jgi:hypothetical protein